MKVSPCVHSIQAASLDKMDMVYVLLKNIRLDLDDYNKRLKRLSYHPSMAGTWMVLEGFE
jgi:maltose phosphorylase